MRKGPQWRHSHIEQPGMRKAEQAVGCRGGGGANIRELALQILHGGVVHGERVHEVLRVPSDAQLLAAPRLAVRRLQVACRATPLAP